MTLRKANVVYNAWASLTLRYGWSDEKAREQVCLDYHLTADEFREAFLKAVGSGL